MPEKEVVAKAKRKLRSGKSPTTAAGELIRQAARKAAPTRRRRAR